MSVTKDISEEIVSDFSSGITSDLISSFLGGISEVGGVSIYDARLLDLIMNNRWPEE